MHKRSDESIVGKKVAIIVSDPWELVTAVGSGPFLAEILMVAAVGSGSDDEGALIKLVKALRFEGGDWEYFVATTRHRGDGLSDLLSGKEVICNLTAISKAQASSAAPVDTSWWRGGLGLIGTLQTLP